VGGAAAAALPKDPCALLTPAEIQAALAPNAKVGNGVADASMAPLGVACSYKWGPRTPQWGESSVSVTVIDVAKGWPGRSAEAINEGILAKAKKGGPEASQVSGVGDAAAFTYEARSFNATVETHLKAKGVHLSVKFHGGDAVANKDKLVALLKSAAGRL